MRNSITNIKKYFTFKYRLKEKIEKLNYNDYRIAKNTLPKILNINKRTFQKYLYTKIEEKYEMPAGHLAILARFFNCRMEDLLNYTPTLVTLKQNIQNDKSTLATSLGLKK